jgi:hypothetical protein
LPAISTSRRRYGDGPARCLAIVEIGLAHGPALVVAALLDARVVDVLTIHGAILPGDRVSATFMKSNSRQKHRGAQGESSFRHFHFSSRVG